MPSCIHRMILTLAVAALPLLLSACGQMGPLYLPVEEPAEEASDAVTVDASEQEAEREEEQP